MGGKKDGEDEGGRRLEICGNRRDEKVNVVSRFARDWSESRKSTNVREMKRVEKTLMKGGRKSGKWEGIEQRPRVVGTRKKRIIGISLKIRRMRYKGKSNAGRGQVV